MHKLESFALSCGSKISKPQLNQSYYPIKEDKYIVFCQDSDSPSKTYDYFDDIIFHIKPYLDKKNIQIIELPSKDKTPLFYCNRYPDLTYNQANYVISKSMLYCGNMNLHTHVSALLNKPSVTLSNYDYIDTYKPYWSNDKKNIILFKNQKNKPSFSSQEDPKTINQVHPEEAASKILNLLKIKHKLKDIKTVFVGPEYNLNIVDIVPGSYDPSSLQLDNVCNIRMDKSFNVDFLAACQKIKKINIVTNQSIPIDILNSLKENIKQISFFIDKNTTQEDVSSLEFAGIPIKLMSKDSKNIADIRLRFLDYVISEYGQMSQEDLKPKTDKNLKFLSKRNIIMDGQVYNSYLSASQGKNTSSVKYCDDFWEDLPFCRIYKQIT